MKKAIATALIVCVLPFGVMVARQKNDFIYAIAEDDTGSAADGSKDALKQKTQSFFESIALKR